MELSMCIYNSQKKKSPAGSDQRSSFFSLLFCTLAKPRVTRPTSESLATWQPVGGLGTETWGDMRSVCGGKLTEITTFLGKTQKWQREAPGIARNSVVKIPRATSYHFSVLPRNDIVMSATFISFDFSPAVSWSNSRQQVLPVGVLASPATPVALEGPQVGYRGISLNTLALKGLLPLDVKCALSPWLIVAMDCAIIYETDACLPFGTSEKAHHHLSIFPGWWFENNSYLAKLSCGVAIYKPSFTPYGNTWVKDTYIHT